MMPPSTCNVVKANPRTYLKLNSTALWVEMDACYNLRLRKTCHAIILYHFASESSKRHSVFNRLTRNSVPIKHTSSVSGDALNTGNICVWTGALDQGDNNICLEYTNSGQEVAATDSRSHLTRSLTIIYYYWHTVAMSVEHTYCIVCLYACTVSMYVMYGDIFLWTLSVCVNLFVQLKVACA